MNFNKLYYFQQIAKYESIRKASEELFVSQSALSKSLHELEEELDVSLFERRGKKLLLNSDGHLLLQMVDSILDQVANIKPRLDEARNKNRSITIDTLYYEAFPIIFSLINNKFPDTHLICKSTIRPGKLYVQDIISGTLDIAIVPFMDKELEHNFFICDEYNVKYFHIAQERLYISAPKRQPYLSMNFCKLEDIRNMPLIKPGDNVWSSTQLEQLFLSKKKPLKYFHEMNTNAFLQGWPENDFPFVTTLLYINHRKYHDGFLQRHQIRIDEPDAAWNIFMLYRGNASEEVLSFASRFKEQVYDILFPIDPA